VTWNGGVAGPGHRAHVGYKLRPEAAVL
jgi:hypothetical protein